MRASLICGATLLAIAGAAMGAPKSVPVNIGDVPELDACVSWGVVTVPTLMVRSGPGTKYSAVDSVHKAQGLHLCDANGDWIGVVYAPPGGTAADCGVSVKLAARQPYAGPCKSGWVHKGRVLVAVR
jgi:hypothetical protein